MADEVTESSLDEDPDPDQAPTASKSNRPSFKHNNKSEINLDEAQSSTGDLEELELELEDEDENDSIAVSSLSKKQLTDPLKKVNVLNRVISSLVKGTKRKWNNASKSKPNLNLTFPNENNHVKVIRGNKNNSGINQQQPTTKKKNVVDYNTSKGLPKNTKKASTSKEFQTHNKETDSKESHERIYVDAEVKPDFTNRIQLKALEKIRFIQDLTIPNCASDHFYNHNSHNHTHDATVIPTASVASATWDDNDAFSIRTGNTDCSSAVSADDISIRTEDFVDKDGTVRNYAYSEIIDESARYDNDSDVTESSAKIEDYDIYSPNHGRKPMGTSVEGYDPEGETDSSTALAEASSSNDPDYLSTFKTVVSKFTQKTFRWNHAYKSLTIKSCVHSITSEQLHRSKESLVTLKFAQVTCFKIIINFLKNCPNLKKLTFANIQLVQKKTAAVDFKSVTLTLANVRELEMTESFMCLTNNDYWLLNFFTNNVNFRKLHSFTFRGTDTFYSERHRRKCERAILKIKVNSSVGRFLVKNRDTLRKVSMGGVGFKLFEEEDTSRSYVDLTTVSGLDQLKVSLGVHGMDLILRNQTKLSSLACCGPISASQFGETLLRNTVHFCITKNCNSLKAVGIFPSIIQTETAPSFIPHNKVYTFDCEAFQNCKKLESIFLNTTMCSRIVSPRNPCGQVINLHALPLSLVKIEIYNYEFKVEELDMLGKRFPKLIKLRKLILSSARTRTYVIHLTWLKSLFGLKNFSSADFFGGTMEDRDAFRDYVLSKPKGYMSMVKIADCVSFYKNS